MICLCDEAILVSKDVGVKMKRIGIDMAILLLLGFTPILAYSETIDVNIKGVDDGVKTNKQRDYKEAVLFAKREAIERAGVQIKSITTVKDLVLNSAYIESQAEAVLLPGYNIIDIGYQADGTYLVVLVGKVSTGTIADEGFKPPIVAVVGRFHGRDLLKYHADGRIHSKSVSWNNGITIDGDMSIYGNFPYINVEWAYDGQGEFKRSDGTYTYDKVRSVEIYVFSLPEGKHTVGTDLSYTPTLTVYAREASLVVIGYRATMNGIPVIQSISPDKKAKIDTYIRKKTGKSAYEFLRDEIPKVD